MITFIFALLFLGLSMIGIVVRKTYSHLPLHELKRRAEKQEPLATQLYRAAAYGSSLQVLLGTWIAVTGAIGLVLLSQVAPIWLSIIAVVALLWAAYSWLPSTKVSGLGARLTSLLTPPIVWITGTVYPPLNRIIDFSHRRHREAKEHTGLYEREDLLALIEQQQHQPDSRLSIEELEIVRRALSFDEYKVTDIVTPRKRIKTVLATDTLGPILIDELHKNGEVNVLVRETTKGAFVGSLDYTHLDIHQTGLVKDVMNRSIYYVHENDSLAQALHAFFVTNHAMFVVVNSFEEYIGIITIEKVLRQLLGHVPGDEFSEYADIKAVARRHDATTATENISANTENVLE